MDFSEKDFTEIIKENEGRLKHLSRVYADRIDEENDIYQEIIIRIWRSLSSFKGEAHINTWIYRLAINTAISFIRKKRIRQDYYTVFQKEKKVQRDIAQPARHAHEDNHVTILYEAISRLNASEKALLTMYLEDFSYAEIAFVTKLTENYVGVKLNRIKRKFLI